MYSPHVVVIGAGIVGAATAYYLRMAGVNVTLLEAESPSAGATGASDGAVSVASKRPGLMMRLAGEARALYGDLATQGVLAGAFHIRPTYLFSRSTAESALIERQGEDLRSQGETVRSLSRAELLRKIPGLGDTVLAAIEVPQDGHAIGYEVVDRLLASARVTPRRHTRVRSLRVVNGRVTGVETQDQTLAADAVVVAAGLGSGDLLGLGQFLIPRKGQLIVTDRAMSPGTALPGPLMAASYLAAKLAPAPVASPISLVIDPLRTGQFLIGSSREEGRSDRQTDARIVASILRDALEVYPALAQQRMIRSFAGIRTATRDGLPIVGRHPLLDGLVVATGFEGDGICLGPLMGAVAARLARGAEPGLDIAALSPARFLAETVSV